MIAFAIGLCALLPFVGVLDEKDFRRSICCRFSSSACALGMGEVLETTGALSLVTNSFIAGIEPLLTDNECSATAVLYWGGFFYHIVTASEISMLVDIDADSDGVLQANGLDPLGRPVWSFATGGKLFAYQSALLVLGYATVISASLI